MQEVDIFLTFLRKIEVSKIDVLKYVRLVNLMAWEQLLLLLIYARSIHKNNYGGHLHYRLQLLHITLKYQNSDILKLVSDLLDDGESFIVVVNSLQCLAKEDGSKASLINNIICEFETEQIAFAKLSSPFFYSHLALYKAIFNVINSLKSLMELPSEEVLLRQSIVKVIHDFDGSKTDFERFSNIQIDGSRLNRLKSINDVNRLARLIENANLNECEILKVSFYENLDRTLSECIGKALNDFLHTQDRSFDPSEKNKNIFKISTEATKKTFELSADCHNLQGLLLMGQVGQILQEVEGLLTGWISSSKQLNKYTNVRPSDIKLSDWYLNCRTPELKLKKLEQVPRLIAAILDFDIRHAHFGFGFYGLHFNYRHKDAIKPAEASSITTKIINNCFLLDQDVTTLYDHVNSLTAESCEEAMPDSKLGGTSELKNYLSIWAVDNPLKEKERFREPRKSLDQFIQQAEAIVESQIHRAIHFPFPVHTAYPRPLWLPMLSRQVVSSKNV